LFNSKTKGREGEREGESRAEKGERPLAVSPESITQSAPSRTAFATSLTSALVGRGLLVMLFFPRRVGGVGL